MKIDLEKFWEFLRQWSVGKIIVTLSLLIVLYYGHLYPEIIKPFFFVGVFHELFDLSHNKVDSSEKGLLQKIVFNFFMLISISSIMAICYIVLWAPVIHP